LPYLQVENAVIQSLALSGNEKLFYITLKSFRNRKTRRCFPSIKRVIERAGISKKTAYKCRNRLKDIGLIAWTNERGRKHSCHYRFTLEEAGNAEIERVLEMLAKKKIEEKETSLNRRKENRLNREKENLRIAQNVTTNKKNITKGNITNKESDLLPSSLLPNEGKVSAMPEWVKEKRKKIFAPTQLTVDRGKELDRKAELRRQAKELKNR